MPSPSQTPKQDTWHANACILCECNCGIEVQTGGKDNREIVRIRGDKAHPSSQGYLCQKASGLNFYQNGKDRISSPMRRRQDGSFEAIDWNTAISEIAERLLAVKDTWGGDKIFYYGGGGQGNHLPGAYAAATRKVLGSYYRSSALAQEKTGEFWVNGHMFGQSVKGDFENTDVAVFIGKNPWHSHGVHRARAWLKEFSKDTNKKMIVIDPVITETAKMADIHLRVKPGTDAWLLTAMIALIVQRDYYKDDWLHDHSQGLDDIIDTFKDISVIDYCAIAGVSVELVEAAVIAITQSNSTAFYEDLGVQMNRHSTLVSYLEKLVWVLSGHFGNKGGHYIPTYLVNIVGSGKVSRSSPVVGAPIISGMVPCNVISDEILTDHPDRYRAMIIETANPVHSLAASQRMTEALRSLDTVVVIDIAMTETARQADYILPASNQFEKWEATFFNFEFPINHFQLRKPLFEPLNGTLPEAEIHARLIETMGVMPDELCSELNDLLDNKDHDGFRNRFMQAMGENSIVNAIAPIILYRTLGRTLPEGAAAAAILWPLLLQLTMRDSPSVSRAGFEGNAFAQADALFDAIINGHSGVVFAIDDYSESWKRLESHGKINLIIPELLAELAKLESGFESLTTEQYPYLLMAGERRDYSANTIYRDSRWRRKDMQGALRMNSADAQQLGVATGDQVQLTTKVGSASTIVEINDRMQPGHLSLPNGFGLDNEDGSRVGVAINELTSTSDCDPFAGTPWHKTVAVQVQAI